MHTEHAEKDREEGKQRANPRYIKCSLIRVSLLPNHYTLELLEVQRRRKVPYCQVSSLTFTWASIEIEPWGKGLSKP